METLSNEIPRIPTDNLHKIKNIFTERSNFMDACSAVVDLVKDESFSSKLEEDQGNLETQIFNLALKYWDETTSEEDRAELKTEIEQLLTTIPNS